MNVESGLKINLERHILPQALISESLQKSDSEILFYADTSKGNGQLVTFPMNAEINLEDEERRIDGILLGHLSPYEKSRHWPRLHTTVDPQNDQIYKIVEFPIVIDAQQYFSIKQSVRERGKLIALCYRLAEMENETILSSRGRFYL